MTAALALVTEGSAAPSAPTRPHATYCGASDMPAILDLDPHRTQLDCWAEKTGRLATEVSEAMEAGNDHESGVIAGYRRRVVVRAQIVSEVIYPGPGTLISPKDPRRGATPDAIARHLARGSIGVQAKYVGTGMAPGWGAEEDGPEGVPAGVLVQSHWEALHMREALGFACEVHHVAADLGTDRRVYEVPIDETLLADLLDAFSDWWARHVEGDAMPMVGPRDRGTLGRLYPRAGGELLEETPLEIVELAEQYEKVRAAAKLVEVEKDRVASLLTAAIGDGAGFKGLWGKAAWRNQSRTTTDWKTVAHALAPSAALIAANTTTTEGRVIDVRLKKAKE